MNKIKKGDEVAVLCGRDRGRRGVVLRVQPDSRGKPEKVLVEGVNMVSHYERPDPRQNRPGGIVKREAPIHASNVSPIDPKNGRPSRVKINGDKKRVFASGAELS
ncbi:MAG: 50S ribosomal protein L24 [Gammaproteobacteria bacterium]